MKIGLIYMATCKITNKSYIGQTIKSLNERISGHYYDSKNRDYKFHRALRKYNKQDWEWKVIYKVSIEQLSISEICAIYTYDTFHSGYNSTLGGEDNPMYNPESRKKVSNSLKGRVHSEEHKRKNSEAQTGNKIWLGKKHKEESKQKMSKSMKGRIPWNKGLSKVEDK